MSLRGTTISETLTQEPGMQRESAGSQRITIRRKTMGKVANWCGELDGLANIFNDLSEGCETAKIFIRHFDPAPRLQNFFNFEFA